MNYHQKNKIKIPKYEKSEIQIINLLVTIVLPLDHRSYVLFDGQNRRIFKSQTDLVHKDFWETICRIYLGEKDSSICFDFTVS